MGMRFVASYLMASTNTSAMNFADREFLLNRDLFIRSFKKPVTTKSNGLSWPHARNTWQAATDYFTGLLKPGDGKHMQGLSDRMDTPQERLQQFITDSPWEHDAVQTHLLNTTPTRFDTDDAILNVDGVAMLKDGTQSVGVDRQYAGCVGKVANSQVAVDLTLTVPGDTYNANQLTWPLGMELYLPEDWVSAEGYDDRREAVGLPNDISFRTKPQIALDLINRARGKVSHACVGGDTGFGDSREFRSQLRKWDESYIFEVTTSELRVVPEQTPIEYPEDYNGPGRTPTDPRYFEGVSASSPRELAEQIDDKDEERTWTELTWQKGTDGDLSAEFARQRVRVVKDTQRRAVTEETGWLLLQKRDGELKSWLCWDVDEWSLDRLALYAHQRWPIEQFHRESKQIFGINDFQGRTWDGWHHHVTVVLLAYGFLSTERARSEKDETGALPTLPEVADTIGREHGIHYLVNEFGMDRSLAQEAVTGLLRTLFGKT